MLKRFLGHAEFVFGVMVVIWIMAFKVFQCLLEGYDWIKDSAFDVPSCEPDFHDLSLEAKVKGEKTGRSYRQDLVNDLTMHREDLLMGASVSGH